MPRSRENQSWMIPSAVFVAAVALQKKCLLSSKLSRNPGSMSKTYTHVSSPSGKCMPVSREKLWGMLREHGVDRCLLLAVKSPYSCSEDCVSVDGVKLQPFSAGVGLRQWCVLSRLLFIVYIRVLRTTARGTNPTYEAISPGRKTHFANNQKILQSVVKVE